MIARYILRNHTTHATLVTRESIPELFRFMEENALEIRGYSIDMKVRTFTWKHVASGTCEQIKANNYEMPKECYYDRP